MDPQLELGNANRTFPDFDVYDCSVFAVLADAKLCNFLLWSTTGRRDLFDSSHLYFTAFHASIADSLFELFQYQKVFDYGFIDRNYSEFTVHENHRN